MMVEAEKYACSILIRTEFDKFVTKNTSTHLKAHVIFHTPEVEVRIFKNITDVLSEMKNIIIIPSLLD